MIVSFYLDFDKEIKSISITKVIWPEPIDFLQKVEECLINNLPINKMGKDEHYKAKLTHRYVKDGAGASFFDGYDIKECRSCTRFV